MRSCSKAPVGSSTMRELARNGLLGTVRAIEIPPKLSESCTPPAHCAGQKSRYLSVGRGKAGLWAVSRSESAPKLRTNKLGSQPEETPCFWTSEEQFDGPRVGWANANVSISTKDWRRIYFAWRRVHMIRGLLCDVIDRVIDDQVKKVPQRRTRRGTLGSRELREALAVDRS